MPKKRLRRWKLSLAYGCVGNYSKPCLGPPLLLRCDSGHEGLRRKAGQSRVQPAESNCAPLPCDIRTVVGGLECPRRPPGSQVLGWNPSRWLQEGRVRRRPGKSHPPFHGQIWARGGDPLPLARGRSSLVDSCGEVGGDPALPSSLIPLLPAPTSLRPKKGGREAGWVAPVALR